LDKKIAITLGVTNIVW